MCPVDDIPNFVFKVVADIIAPVLTFLINKSVREGVFPTKFK